MPATEQIDPRITAKHEDDALLPQKRVATLLSVSPRALEAWRMRGEGPPFIRISKRCVRYRRTDVEHWLATRQAQQ